MTLELNDFNSQGLAVNDFEGMSLSGLPLSKNTVAPSAASVALLSGQGMEGYATLTDSFMAPNNRDQAIAALDSADKAVAQDAMYEAGGVLANETEDPRVKDFVIGQFQDAKWENMLKGRRKVDLLAEEAAVSSSRLDETARDAEARLKAIDSVQSVNDHKIEMQKLINGLKSQRSAEATGLSEATDFAELFVPFAEWIRLDRLEEAVLDDEYKIGLLGQQKQHLVDTFEAMPLEKKEEVVQGVIELFQENPDIRLPDGNDIVLIDALEKMAGLEDYSTAGRYWDNIVSVLDMVGIGSTLSMAGRAGKAAKSMDAAADMNSTVVQTKAYEAGRSVGAAVKAAKEGDFAKAASTLTRSDVGPTSPSQVVKETNPELAREMHRAVVTDETGDMAQGAYGTTREEAIGKDLLPEADVANGSVPNKVEMMPDPKLEPEEIRDLRRSRGSTEISDEGLQRIETKIESSLDEVGGMKLHENSLVMGRTRQGKLNIRARYSPTDAGLSSPQEATENAKVAFRNYGLSDEEITVLKKEGDSWNEVKGDTGEGEYAVALDFDYGWSAQDLDVAEAMQTNGGILPRMVQKLDTVTGDAAAKSQQGSIVQNMLDPHSVLKPQFVNAAAVAVDKSYALKKLYVELFDGFTKKYAKLKKARRAAVSDYIHQANFEGLKFDEADLYRRGFSADEIEALRDWRRSNDAMWFAANEDMAHTLINKGYVSVVDTANDTRLVGKPAQRGAVGQNTHAYDPTNHTVIKMKKATLDELYAGGGEFVRFDEPMSFGGREVNYVLSYNRTGRSYSRRIRPDDKVLNYRDGYYPRMYDANYFLEKKVIVDGEERVKVVASAKTTKEKNQFLEQLASEKGLSKEEIRTQYNWRKDRRSAAERTRLSDEGAWSLAQNSGLSYQRVRGQQLEDAGLDLHKQGYQHLVDPLEAVARQIQSMSSRTSMRPYLENMKTNWVKYYGPELNLPKDKITGKEGYPKNIDDIKPKEGTPSRVVEDAKAYFNYVNGLENGYMNAVDELYRGIMQAAASELGSLLGPKAEKALFGLSTLSPTHTGKTAAFKLYLAANPVRQAIIQRSQMALLPVADPLYVSSGQMVQDMYYLTRARFGVKVDKRYERLLEEARRTGVLEAVDSNNLIRSDVLRMADVSSAQKAGKVASAPLNYLQKIGFDAAEQDVLLSAWLTFRNRAKAAGKDLKSQRVQDEILGQTRAFTLNMNRSGDMPYAQNTFSLMTQFFQFQHKALLQTLTNKSLTFKQRTSLMAYSAVLFGSEASVVSFALSQLMEKDKNIPMELKDQVEAGLLDVGLNKLLTELSGEEQQIDFGDLAPSNAYDSGMGKILIGILEMDAKSVFASAPSASLVAGPNPKLLDFYKTTARYFVPPADYNDELLETQPVDIMMGALNMFSGMSAAFRARYAYHLGKAMSSTGRITDNDVTKVEAFMMSAGFRTKTQDGMGKVYEELWGDMEVQQDDVKLWYKELKRQLARTGDSVQEREYRQAVLREAWHVFGTDREKAIEVIMQEMSKDLQNGEVPLYRLIMNQVGFMEPDDVWKLINKMPAGEARDAAVQEFKARTGE